MSELVTFIGTSTRVRPPNRPGPGIASCRFDEQSGALRVVSETTDIDNASWITVDAARHRLYAASEVETWKENLVSAYEFDPATGALSYVNKQPSLGNCTCHIGLSPDGRWLVAANYAALDGTFRPDQSLALYRLGEDELPPPCGRVRHAGHGPNAARQSRPHAHCATFTPDGGRLLVIDLGIDRMLTYAVSADGNLVAMPELDFAFEPGRGPRHLALHPDGRTVLVDYELQAGVTVLRLGAGVPEPVHTIDAHYDGEAYPSAIQVSPDGRHAYMAVRGPGEIVGYAIAGDRRLTEIGRWPCGGTWPRDAALSPSGRWLLIANQDTDNVTILARDPETGALSSSGEALQIGTPMRIAFA